MIRKLICKAYHAIDGATVDMLSGIMSLGKQANGSTLRSSLEVNFTQEKCNHLRGNQLLKVQ